MRNRFDKELEALNVELIKMGALCEDVIALVAKALESKSEKLIEKIRETDSCIDSRQREIEALCMRLLLQQQPVARDLRQISSAMRMISDMERIGDQASDISDIISYMDADKTSGRVHINDMARATIKMVSESVESFVEKDIDMAHAVIAYDDTVDELFTRVKAEISALISNDMSFAQYALDMLMIAKYFEKIGDHAVNIAEWVIYSINGEQKSKK